MVGALWGLADNREPSEAVRRMAKRIGVLRGGSQEDTPPGTRENTPPGGCAVPLSRVRCLLLPSSDRASANPPPPKKPARSFPGFTHFAQNRAAITSGARPGLEQRDELRRSAGIPAQTSRFPRERTARLGWSPGGRRTQPLDSCGECTTRCGRRPGRLCSRRRPPVRGTRRGTCPRA